MTELREPLPAYSKRAHTMCPELPPARTSTLSLHDALPIWAPTRLGSTAARRPRLQATPPDTITVAAPVIVSGRSEEHTSELQSRLHLVCRLLLEKKNQAPKCSKHSLESRARRFSDSEVLQH